MSVDVLGDIAWFRENRGKDAPVILTLYHGTTHAFDAFAADKVNTENMFGRQLYFSSCRDDAENNYARVDGPDLKNRIELMAERNLEDAYDTHEEAVEAAKAVLYGGQDAVLTVELTLNNPFILGQNAPHGVVRTYEDLYPEAVRTVAEDNGITEEEVSENEDYEDAVQEEIDRLSDEDYDGFVEILNRALSVLGMEPDKVGADQILYGLFRETESADEVFKAVESNEEYLYLYADETMGYYMRPIIAEILHQKGHDAIILPNAEAQCRNMNMISGTTHVALSVDHLSQIRVLDRCDLREDVGFGM